ncbi:MAG: DNA repair protein RecN, partial [Muribaculaceae bacterium]|nr:DNA repair protein RecN [Muribaculaceae bacterium]
SIVFDEVDTGVSGDVANRMGAMMLAISERLQVLTITHLPQVAARGVSHYKVFKEDDTEATHTRIRRLDENERLGELALMLSGSSTDEAALANARSLMQRK